MFKVEAKKKTLKSFEALSEKRKDEIKEIIIALKSDPIPFRKFDVVKLKGYENNYRVRVGNLRVVYEVNWDEKRILIHFIGSRKKAYK
jgi:mRNA interferase RelE/StbE